MNWQSFLFISIIFSSVVGLFHRILMKEENSDAKAQTIVFLGLIGVLTFAISLFRGFSFPQFPLLLPNFILIIILGTLAPIFTFRAFQLIDTAEVGILLSSQRLWTVLAALIFLGETLTISKTFGIILILIGVAIISWKKHKIKIGKGEFYAILSAFLYGISYVNAFYILQHMDAILFEAYACLLPAFSLILIQPRTIKKIRFYFIPKNAARILIVVTLDIIATISFYVAYQIGRNASQIAPLSAISIMITAILAAIFLNERKNLVNKIIGSTIVIMGAILIV